MDADAEKLRPICSGETCCCRHQFVRREEEEEGFILDVQ